jgi:hypothetical protein
MSICSFFLCLPQFYGTCASACIGHFRCHYLLVAASACWDMSCHYVLVAIGSTTSLTPHGSKDVILGVYVHKSSPVCVKIFILDFC